MHNKVLSIRNLSKDLLIDEEESNSRQPPVASESHPTLSGESANSRVPDATSGIFSRPQTRSTCTYTESNFVPTPLTELVCPVTPSTHILSAHLASTPGSVGRDQFPIGLRVGKDRSPKETPRDFHGRLKRWPGILFLLVVTMAVIGGLFLGASSHYWARHRQALIASYNKQLRRKIRDSKSDVIFDVADDGQMGNPKYFPDQHCALSDYQSKGGYLVAVGPGGEETPLHIKGVNWSGMETSLSIPLGMWENPQNGTTLYEIGAFLARNKFNAVRIPVSIENILRNSPPADGIINMATNRAVSIRNFISTLKSIIIGLGQHGLGVLISLHRLTNMKDSGNWYDATLGISQKDYLNAVDIISSSLCKGRFWNVMGLDLKNEPYKATWGTGSSDDFVIGAEKIAAVMHRACPRWVGIVEGIAGEHTLVAEGNKMQYYDWWGGGLQKAKTVRPHFGIPNKLVWGPHYYTTAVAPQPYFYGPLYATEGICEELDNATLKNNIESTMHDMFGYLADERDSAVLLGEFGGLYALDGHPMKTIQRTVEYTIQIMKEQGYAGGFMWSLNPENAYEYNSCDGKGHFVEGLLKDDWLTPNTKSLAALSALDNMPYLKRFPCYRASSTVTK